MSQRVKAIAAVALGVVALTILVANLALVWTLEAAGSAGRPPAATLWLLGLAGAPVVGIIIAGRRPDSSYGWLLLSFGVTSGLLELTELYALYALERYGVAGTPGVAGALISQTLWGATIGHLPFLLLLFPDGRLPSPRWRWFARATAGVTVIASLTALFMPGDLGVVPVPNPFGARGPWGTAVTIVVMGGTVAVFAAMFPAAASLFVRRRRGTALERLQLRWFSYASALLAVALILSAFVVPFNEVIVNAVLMLALMGLFAAIGVAVLRYRLYDIDRIISRTVSYAALTVIVVGVYLAMVTVLSQITSSVAGSSPLAVASSTLAAAAVIGPARRRIQNGVDRRFNRARYDAGQAVEEYRTRLRSELDLETISAGLLTTVGATLGPTRTALWLQGGQG